jgi:hypothetical protein
VTADPETRHDKVSHAPIPQWGLYGPHPPPILGPLGVPTRNKILGPFGVPTRNKILGPFWVPTRPAEDKHKNTSGGGHITPVVFPLSARNSPPSPPRACARFSVVLAAARTEIPRYELWKPSAGIPRFPNSPHRIMYPLSARRDSPPCPPPECAIMATVLAAAAARREILRNELRNPCAGTPSLSTPLHRTPSRIPYTGSLYCPQLKLMNSNIKYNHHKPLFLPSIVRLVRTRTPGTTDPTQLTPIRGDKCELARFPGNTKVVFSSNVIKASLIGTVREPSMGAWRSVPQYDLPQSRYEHTTIFSKNNEQNDITTRDGLTPLLPSWPRRRRRGRRHPVSKAQGGDESEEAPHKLDAEAMPTLVPDPRELAAPQCRSHLAELCHDHPTSKIYRRRVNRLHSESHTALHISSTLHAAFQIQVGTEGVSLVVTGGKDARLTSQSATPMNAHHALTTRHELPGGEGHVSVEADGAGSAQSSLHLEAVATDASVMTDMTIVKKEKIRALSATIKRRGQSASARKSASSPQFDDDSGVMTRINRRQARDTGATKKADFYVASAWKSASSPQYERYDPAVMTTVNRGNYQATRATKEDDFRAASAWKSASGPQSGGSGPVLNGVKKASEGEGTEEQEETREGEEGQGPQPGREIGRSNGRAAEGHGGQPPPQMQW